MASAGEGNWTRARELCEELVSLGRETGDPVLINRARFMLSETLGQVGDFEGERRQSEAGLSPQNPNQREHDLVQFGVDTQIGSRAIMALAEWQLGLLDSAPRTMQVALDQSRDLSHPWTHAAVLMYAARLSFYRGSPDQVVELSRELVALAKREGFHDKVHQGGFDLGWAIGMQGKEEEGLRMMLEARQGLAFKRFSGIWPQMLADLYVRLGRVDDAVSVIHTSIWAAGSSGVHLWEPELHRFRGELARTKGEPEREAEKWFLRALEIARGQHARVLELRAACSLYRLKKSQGDGERALGELCEAYRGFSEGLETTELTTARRLMGGE